jgi:hypothetical protein
MSFSGSGILIAKVLTPKIVQIATGNRESTKEARLSNVRIPGGVKAERTLH